jgi:hypothetical protein
MINPGEGSRTVAPDRQGSEIVVEPSAATIRRNRIAAVFGILAYEAIHIGLLSRLSLEAAVGAFVLNTFLALLNLRGAFDWFTDADTRSLNAWKAAAIVLAVFAALAFRADPTILAIWLGLVAVVPIFGVLVMISLIDRERAGERGRAAA